MSSKRPVKLISYARLYYADIACNQEAATRKRDQMLMRLLGLDDAAQEHGYRLLPPPLRRLIQSFQEGAANASN